MLAVFPKPVEISYSSSHSKSDVFKSLGEIVSLKGDHFAFPVRVFGNHLVVQRRWIIGTGHIRTVENKMLINISMRPSAEIKIAAVFSLLATASFFFAGVVLLLKNYFLPSLAVFMGAAIFFAFPPALFSIAVQMQIEVFDSAILGSKRS